MFYRSIAEFETNASPSDAERALIAACRAGEMCILGDGTLPAGPHDSRTIRAALLRLLITGGTPKCRLHPSGVWVVGAFVPDELDLSFETGKGRCALDNCRFAMKPHFAHAHLVHLSLQGSYLLGVFAHGIKVDGSISLRNVTAEGTVDLNFADIGG